MKLNIYELVLMKNILKDFKENSPRMFSTEQNKKAYKNIIAELDTFLELEEENKYKTKCEKCGTTEKVEVYKERFLCEKCRDKLINSKLELRKEIGLGNDQGFNSIFR